MGLRDDDGDGGGGREITMLVEKEEEEKKKQKVEDDIHICDIKTKRGTCISPGSYLPVHGYG